jgi:hypothetical protein
MSNKLEIRDRLLRKTKFIEKRWCMLLSVMRTLDVRAPPGALDLLQVTSELNTGLRL